MKILIADTQYPKGHYNLNTHLLQLLLDLEFIDELKILNYKQYYKENNKIEKISFFKIKRLFFSKNEYLNYLLSFLNALIIKIKLLTIKSDKIIFFTFDTLSFFLIDVFINKPIYLFHHNNVDHLANKYKFQFFKLYMNKVNHIVFEEFIKESLVSKGVDEKLIYVVNHPLPTSLIYHSLHDDEKVKRYVGLGHGNDEELISQIVNYEQNTSILQNNNIELVIRSRQKYTNLPISIKIVNTFLSKEEYADLYSTALGILILFPYSFRYRFSGTLLDACYCKKVVIGRNIPIVECFNQQYPKSCHIFDNIEHLFSLLLESNEFNEYEFSLFSHNYSDINIERQLYEVLL